MNQHLDNSGIHRFKSRIKRVWRALCGHLRKLRLRKTALRCKDEHFRLAAASQLKDETILRQIALSAAKASIRKEAAAVIGRPSFLAAIALSSWDIELGREVVVRIQNDLLLRRVAEGARQDAVRLAAAQKLGDAKLIKKTAFATADISLRWESARHLNDPDLMAALALLKPGHTHLDMFRHQAKVALLEYLNELRQTDNINGLLSFILIQDHLPFKLEAFLRLPAEAVQTSTLQHLSRQAFTYIEEKMIQRMLAKIESAGWSLTVDVRSVACSHCKGRGLMSVKTVSAAASFYKSETVACAECSGIGEIFCRMVSCTDRDRSIEFKLPITYRAYSTSRNGRGSSGNLNSELSWTA